MTDWSGLRKKWSDTRDKAGVKKGSVSGVSLGDAIDKVGKAQTKGYNSMVKALEALKDDAAKYKSKVLKTHPDLGKWIDRNIADEVKDLHGKVLLDMNSLKWMIDNMMAGSDLNIMVILPDEGMIQNAMRLMADKTKPMSFAEAVKAVNMFYVVETYGALLAKRAMTMKSTKWQAKLTGHDAEYAALVDFADIVIDDVKEVALWSKAKSLGEWGDAMKKLKNKQTAVDHLPRANKAVKGLLA
ncbi:MAG: hypothetical protein ABI832_16825 [bacterium]